MEIRNFVYVDHKLLPLYFKQLDERYTKHCSRVHSTIRSRIVISVSPKFSVEEEETRTQDNEHVRMIPCLEKYFADKGVCGDGQSLVGEFVSARLEVNYVYARLTGEGEDRNLFMAVPCSGSPERWVQGMPSFFILGDVANCWFADADPKHSVADSPLSCVVRLWDYFMKTWQTDVGMAFIPENMSFIPEYGEASDVSHKLVIVERWIEMQPNKNRATVSGILRVRQRVGRDGERTCVLYPLFLEQLGNTV